MTALCWIKNERTWKPYVQNRVEKIRQLSHWDTWRHCPGDLNPADIPSRDIPVVVVRYPVAQNLLGMYHVPEPGTSKVESMQDVLATKTKLETPTKGNLNSFLQL